MLKTLQKDECIQSSVMVNQDDYDDDDYEFGYLENARELEIVYRTPQNTLCEMLLIIENDMVDLEIFMDELFGGVFAIYEKSIVVRYLVVSNLAVLLHSSGGGVTDGDAEAEEKKDVEKNRREWNQDKFASTNGEESAIESNGLSIHSEASA